MDRALYIAMSGAKHNMQAQAIHANNLANVSTQGFKADFAQARSMGVYYGEGYASRAYAGVESPAIDFAQGTAMATNRELDIALENKGFIAVQNPDGSESYTRNGSLFVDSVGMLKTGNNLPVIGDGGPILVPEHEKIEIAVDGTISVAIKGEAPSGLTEIGRIKLVNPELEAMVKGSDGLFRMKDNSLAVADASVRVTPGFLESSNVKAINELTDILSLARQYELQVKLMQKVDENSQTSARLLQIS